MSIGKISPNDKSVGIFEKLEIYGVRIPPKTGKGKDRVWIRIRQHKPKQWKQAGFRVSKNCADILFEK